MTEDEATGPEDAAGAEEAEVDPDETDSDSQKRRFREALERKTAGPSGGADAHGQSKIHGTHGPAKSQRSFRRKSGG